jgi:hypothetical protein
MIEFAPLAPVVYYPDRDEIGVWVKCSEPGDHSFHHDDLGYFTVTFTPEIVTATDEWQYCVGRRDRGKCH